MEDAKKGRLRFGGGAGRAVATTVGHGSATVAKTVVTTNCNFYAGLSQGALLLADVCFVMPICVCNDFQGSVLIPSNGASSIAVPGNATDK